MSDAIKERSEFREEDKWAIHDIYAGDELWQEDSKRLKALGVEAVGFAGKLGESAQSLLGFLKLSEEVFLLTDALANYAMRKSDEDKRVAKYQDMVGSVMSTFVEVDAATSFATPELMAISDETLENFYAQCPELLQFRRYLSDIRRRREHVLSATEEKLLAAAGEMANSPETIYSMFSDADLTFPDAVDREGKSHPLTQETYIAYLHKADRILRKDAFEKFYATFYSYRNTLASTLNAQVKQLQFFAQARKYENSMQAALDGTNVPTAVYTNLIEAVHKHMDKMYRYIDLRKKLLGEEELHMYDIYVPLLSEISAEIPYEQAVRTVMDAVRPLGEEYGAILKHGFENRWVDVYENVGKRSGAYSAGAKVHPFVLMNYKNTLDSQFTLAHEMGHALHSYLSNREQKPLDAEYVIFVAEVASTCNEALLMEYLLARTTDKKQRAYLINHFLEQFRTTLYRQTMFAEFEMNIGKLSQDGATLTAEALCEEYSRLNKLYYGENMVIDEQIAMEWARIPHFYLNYYVFQYATGYAAAIALSQRILNEGEPAVKDYLSFLSGGCSKSPIDLLKGAGVDMSTTAPVEAALEHFGKLLDEMEALMQD
ncbi:MAG: oligoendopeptidase F [Oscillospiraceae bacterium]|jgi:oligoendopeptidase F|nr:oligoendopeptidase F [Oscillospiraceae bacterium]